jgi:hypothetical protein
MVFLPLFGAQITCGVRGRAVMPGTPEFESNGPHATRTDEAGISHAVESDAEAMAHVPDFQD